MEQRLSEQEIATLNEKHTKETAEDFKEFKADLAVGKCWVCKQQLVSFDETAPCQHWLLLPAGFRKKHLKLLFDTKTYDKIEGFLRWYVNAHEPAKNINDLKDEHDPEKIKAMTIKYENLEWSLSFSKGCIEGKHGEHGPHYHFQMRVDDRPFHDYSDRHIKLSDYELWLLDIEQDKHPQFKKRETYGVGMQGVLDNIEADDLLKSMRTTDNYETAQFDISTLVMADEGHGISGDEVNELIKESRETGVPMHQLIKRLKNVSSTVIIEPGPGVPLAAERTPRKRGKNRKKT